MSGEGLSNQLTALRNLHEHMLDLKGIRIGLSPEESSVTKHNSSAFQDETKEEGLATTTTTTPEFIGRYSVTKTLGTGTFSVVRLGQHEKTARNVALKIMSKKCIAELGAEKHVAREIRHLRLCCAHPNVTELYEVVDAPDLDATILAMECATGGQLLEYINNNGGRLSNEDGRKFFQQLIGGLEFMHNKKVVHRDLKLENLLLDPTRTTIKIADFGFSNIVEEGELMVTPCGSPHHAAPEVVRCIPYAGPPVDIWCSGVILYSMLLGQLPFKAENNNKDDLDELYRKIKMGKYDIPSNGVKWGARELIDGMICVDPLKRFTIKDIKAKDWFKIQLPQYLRCTPEEIERNERQTLDPVVVKKLLHIYGGAITREDVERAVVTKEGAEENDTAKGLRVAYRLEFDRESGQKRLNPKCATRKEKKKTAPSTVVSTIITMLYGCFRHYHGIVVLPRIIVSRRPRWLLLLVGIVISFWVKNVVLKHER